jgi:hypothetical protein
VSLRSLMQRPLPITAPLVLNPLMARMAEAAGFPAGYLGGGATGYQKVSLEANLNLTEMCQAAVDIHAVSSLPLILDGACGYGDPMHMHRTIGMSEAAGFAAIEAGAPSHRHRAHQDRRGSGHAAPRRVRGMAEGLRESCRWLRRQGQGGARLGPGGEGDALDDRPGEAARRRARDGREGQDIAPGSFPQQVVTVDLRDAVTLRLLTSSPVSRLGDWAATAICGSMLIGSPSGRLPDRIAELGGVRLII